MDEKLTIRREANKESYENSEKYQAIKTLQDSGFLIPMDKLDLYHGRSRGQDEQSSWRVQPDFDNAGDNTGNRNTNGIPALNTSLGQSVASSYAKHRAYSGNGTPEVYQIASYDQDASIIDSRFDFQSLDWDTQQQFLSAIDKTLPNITAGAPIPFEYRDVAKNLSIDDFITSNKEGLIYSEDLSKNASTFNIDKKLNRTICAAKNTRTLLHDYPIFFHDLLDAYMGNEDFIFVDDSIDNNSHELPISREYLSNWFREIHAIGIKRRFRSPNILQVFDNYQLFDLEKVNTNAEIDKSHRQTMRRLGKIALAAEKLQSSGNLADALNNNLYIQPQEIIALAKQTPGADKLFEADAGNWEKFTLEEHTETVLRIFDDNFADIMPASTLPIMRLALLVHDIGKSKAAAKNDKKNQARYNTLYATEFMRQNNIEPANRKLILAIIGQGLKYASHYMIDRSSGDEEEKFNQFCEDTMKNYLQTDEVDQETVIGFRNMLEVIQTCDSAAYTTMAVTRSARDGIVYRNYGSFNSSFDPYHGISGKRARFKERNN